MLRSRRISAGSSDPNLEDDGDLERGPVITEIRVSMVATGIMGHVAAMHTLFGHG